MGFFSPEAQTGLKLSSCKCELRFSSILSEGRAEVLHVISPTFYLCYLRSLLLILFSDMPKEPVSCDRTVMPPGDRDSQNTIEQGSEKGYESDVTDSGSELSFETAPRSARGDTDRSLNSLLGTVDTWPSSAKGSRDLDGDKNVATATTEDLATVDDGSSSATLETGKNENLGFTEVDGRPKKVGMRVTKSFSKDSDGGDEISSDSEVPSAFSNPVHGKLILIKCFLHTNSRNWFGSFCLRLKTKQNKKKVHKRSLCSQVPRASFLSRILF